MGSRTSIEWTATVHPDGTVTKGSTWNPIRGCSRVSPGCLNCYAEKVAARFSGDGGPFHLFASRTPKPHWTGKVGLVGKHLLDPLKWRTPRKVFVNSMSDLFHEDLPDEAIDRVFAVMALCPQHSFQVLTKRPQRMRAYLSGAQYGRMCDVAKTIRGGSHSHNCRYPLFNVWLGVSCEDQATADERIPLLLQTPAAVRFVSYEPAIGPVDFRCVVFDLSEVTHDLIEWHTKRGEVVTRASYENYPKGIGIDALTGRNPAAELPSLDWIIVGGESGPGARPFDIQWARSVVDQCRDAGVSVFIKQLGAKPMMDENIWLARVNETGKARLLNPRNAQSIPKGFVPLAMSDGKGGNMDDWDADLRVRQFPAEVPANAL